MEANHACGGIGPGLAGLEQSAVLGLEISDEPQHGGAGDGDNQSGAEARAAREEREHGEQSGGRPGLLRA